MKRYTIHRNNRRLDYTIVGSGTPVFIVGFSEYTYRLLSEAVKARYHYILHDYYGLMNHQGLETIDLSIEHLLDDIHAIQQDLGLTTMNVLGHSQSGTVGLDYVLTFPEHVDNALLICPPPIFNEDYVTMQRDYLNTHLTGKRKARFEHLLKEFRRKPVNHGTTQFFVEYHQAQAPLYFYDYEQERINYFEGLDINQEFITRFIEHTYARYERKQTIASVASKIRVILGKYDFAVPLISWAKYDSTIDISVYPHSAHYPMLEEQCTFDREFNAFMSPK